MLLWVCRTCHYCINSVSVMVLGAHSCRCCRSLRRRRSSCWSATSRLRAASPTCCMTAHPPAKLQSGCWRAWAHRMADHPSNQGRQPHVLHTTRQGNGRQDSLLPYQAPQESAVACLIITVLGVPLGWWVCSKIFKCRPAATQQCSMGIPLHEHFIKACLSCTQWAVLPTRLRNVPRRHDPS